MSLPTCASPASSRIAGVCFLPHSTDLGILPLRLDTGTLLGGAMTPLPQVGVESGQVCASYTATSGRPASVDVDGNLGLFECVEHGRSCVRDLKESQEEEGGPPITRW